MSAPRVSQRRMKDLKWFADQYKAIGYDIEIAKSGHLKIRDPEGRFVTTLSNTPSDWRSDKNGQAKLARHEKARRGGYSMAYGTAGTAA